MVAEVVYGHLAVVKSPEVADQGNALVDISWLMPIADEGTAQSLRDCLNGRIGESLRRQAQGRYAGAPQCGAKPRLRPSSVPERIRFPSPERQYSKTKPRWLAPAGLCF